MIPLSLSKKWKVSPHPLQRCKKALVNIGETRSSFLLDLSKFLKYPPFFCKGKWRVEREIAVKANFYGVRMTFHFQFKELWDHYMA